MDHAGYIAYAAVAESQTHEATNGTYAPAGGTVNGLLPGCFFFSSRRRHTRFDCDWSSDVCSSDLALVGHSEVALDGVLADHVRVRIARLAAQDCRQLDLGSVVVRMIGHDSIGAGQIGRASCRERV